jgi:hypothetical protein
MLFAHILIRVADARLPDATFVSGLACGAAIVRCLFRSALSLLAAVLFVNLVCARTEREQRERSVTRFTSRKGVSFFVKFSSILFFQRRAWFVFFSISFLHPPSSLSSVTATALKLDSSAHHLPGGGQCTHQQQQSNARYMPKRPHSPTPPSHPPPQDPQDCLRSILFSVDRV